MANFYVSDLHFGHENIIKLCKRPFSNVDEMNEVLIKKWNEKVTNGDTVYIIGDLFFRSATDSCEVLKRLKGKKHLIIGNHDKSWLPKMGKDDIAKYFESVSHMQVINTNKGIATLCHYPMMSFEGSFLIHGHIHNNTKNAPYWPLLSKMDDAYNASVEINGYAPVTFDELAANNKEWKETCELAGMLHGEHEKITDKGDGT